MYANLEKVGFSCDGPNKGQRFFTWDCENDLDVVTIYGVEVDVVHVEANGFGPGAQSLLEYVATIPYEGAEPERAKQWVRDNFSRIRASTPIESEFAGVKYTMYGNPEGGAFVLEIGGLE